MTPETHLSILESLRNRYGPADRIRLDVTYRMNDGICAFPSHTWYDDELHPAPEVAGARLELEGLRRDDLLDRLLDPSQPVALLLLNHRGCAQTSELEVEAVTGLACRLILEHGLSPAQLALISPHRAQNNATTERLLSWLDPDRLPLIDTVERVQGAERDVIVYALTASDPDGFESGFLNNPNRFNVAITRARRKLIVIGSQAFFSWIPGTEDGLRANGCFKAFLEHCRERGSLFVAGPGEIIP